MIEIKNLTAGYGNVPKLFDLNCKFQTGKITVIVGPNGSGKSTLLKAMIGIVPIFHGEIWLDHSLLSDYSKTAVARRIAYLPQNRNIPSIRVERLILHGRFPHLQYPRTYTKSDYNIVDEVIEKFQIESLRNCELQQLSGGERQKVYLAMAFAQQADIFLFDEPTTYLDLSYQLDFMNQLKALKEEGKTCITVLHDLNAALNVADQIIVLKQGKLMASGSAKELIQLQVIEQTFHVNVGSYMDHRQERQYYFYD